MKKRSLLFMLNDIFQNQEELWKRICNYSYKYFNVSILEKVHNTSIKKENINRREVTKELVGYYAFPSEQ